MLLLVMLPGRPCPCLPVASVSFFNWSPVIITVVTAALASLLRHWLGVTAFNHLPYQCVVPFFPFPAFEQMLLAQHCLLALRQGLWAPVREGQGRLHGSINLQLYDQPEVSVLMHDGIMFTSGNALGSHFLTTIILLQRHLVLSHLYLTGEYHCIARAWITTHTDTK